MKKYDFKKVVKLTVITALSAVLLVNAVSCSGIIQNVQAADLMEGIEPGKADGKNADEKFIGGSADFAMKLLAQTFSDGGSGVNTLISPLSVMLAMSMTANGAGGSTLSQLEQTLCGGIPIAELNEYLYKYVNDLPSGEKYKLGIANSIWFRDRGFSVKESFLQTNADYYGASAFKSPFDKGTAGEINGWVKEKTDGLIESIVDDIADDIMMYLINAIVFDAEWEKIYNEYQIQDGKFNSADGEQDVKFMNSTEKLYIDDGMATGFIKMYKDNNYAFAALLPNEGVDIADYTASLTGAEFVELIKNAKQATVHASIPKFSCDFTISLNSTLKAMGITDAFAEAADFGEIGNADGEPGLYISNVLHKTYIEVDERGTKAGAVTSVEILKFSKPIDEKYVKLDRPFIYAIVDVETGLPIFLGVLTNCK